MESGLARRKSDEEKKEEAKRKEEEKKIESKVEQQSVYKDQVARGRVQSLGPSPKPAFGGGRFFDISLSSLGEPTQKIQASPISSSADTRLQIPIPSQFSSESDSPHGAQSSPRSYSEGGGESPTERRRKHSSPRISLTGSRQGRPVSPKAVPRLHSPKHSLRIIIDCKESLSPEGELPFSREIANLLLQEAREKFQASVEEEKRKKHPTDLITKNGLSYIVRINAKEESRDYLIIITGNYHSASNYYLLDKNDELGEGASATVYTAYDLLAGTKVAARMLRGELAKADFAYLSKDINRLIVGKSFSGLFYGGVGFSDSTYVIVMPFVAGRPLIYHLYVLDKEVKERHQKDYKDHPKYYQRRIPCTCESQIDLGIAVMRAVLSAHNLQIIHGDISPDNLMVLCRSNSCSGTLIDMDRLIGLGCDVFIATEEPTKENISNFIFESNAAYIRFGKELYYVNRFFNSRSEVPNVNIAEFDEFVRPDAQARRLSAAELDHIKLLTRHAHTAPRVRKINGAYGYVAPELFLPSQPEDPKPFATQKSDFYSLGVDLLDIFADEDENFQQVLKQHFKKMMREQGGSRQELVPSVLKSMVPSIFSKYRVITHNFDSNEQKIENYIDRFIKNRFLRPKVRDLLEGLFVEIPANRFGENEVEKAINDLTTRRSMLVQTAGAVKSILSCQPDSVVSHAMRIINAITVLQQIDISLDKLLPILRDPYALSSTNVEKLFATIVPEVISPKSMPASSFIKLKKAAEEECQLKRSTAYEILDYLIEGWGQLKNAHIQSWPSLKGSPTPKALLEGLANYLALSKGNKEVFEFIGQLTQLALKEEKLNLRR